MANNGKDVPHVKLQHQNVVAKKQNFLDQIRLSISQIKDHEKDIVFMRKLLRLNNLGFTSHKIEMAEIIKTTSLADILLQILKGLCEHEEQVYVPHFYLIHVNIKFVFIGINHHYVVALLNWGN
ncbi:MAG: hypothetical protein EZS28_048827 [Streblomastix strix]|uniref:Uncharacterized protein n=1 Tax=Streblomastix strix TaxID=222440 RepID=A0A5J4TB75_9EUKA|nr:MAG: hypothetical protein EZS28_048827 [Streblomastix strix]